MAVQSFRIHSDDDDIRLDRWFKRHYPNFSHGELQKALRKGLVRLDGKKAQSSDHVATGQELTVKFIDLNAAIHAAPKPERVKSISKEKVKETQSWVIYKDDNVIAINKPAGLAVQGGSKLSDHVDARLSALQFDAKEPPKLVHRLDKDTSGALLLARSAKAASTLSKAFASKRMEKIYWALIIGVPEIREGEIEGALMKSDEAVEKVIVDEEGKKAVTAYRVIEALGNRLSWVELQPITGRTHQLRVHMAQMGHPIVGDGKYGGRDAFIDGIDLPKQLHLHARQIVIDNVFGKTLDVAAPLPQHMQQSFKELGLEA